MGIIIRLDRVMADRKISLGELAVRVGISNVNLSRIKTGKVAAIRFSTLCELCKVLECQPGDLLEYSDREPAALPPVERESKPAKPSASSGKSDPGEDYGWLNY